MNLIKKLMGKVTSANDKVNEKKEAANKDVKTDGTNVSTTNPSTTANNNSNRDFTSNVQFLTQFSKDVGDVDGDGDHDRNDEMIACCKASKLMIQRAGFKTTAANGRIDAAVMASNGKVRPAVTLKEAIALLNKNCDNKMPTLIGINRGKKVGNANTATSHFIVVVARKFNVETGKDEYYFYDPGTSYENKGTSVENVLRFNMEGNLEGTTKYSGANYILTEVRPTSK